MRSNTCIAAGLALLCASAVPTVASADPRDDAIADAIRAGLEARAAVEAEHAARTAATRTVAMAFLDAWFVRQEPDAYARFAHPDFIQHNPEMADGVAAHSAFFAARRAQVAASSAVPPQAHVIDMVLADDDLFAVMHHTVNADGTGRIFVDVWRVEDGRIAEHWDVIQPLAQDMPHDNGMGCGHQTYAQAIALPVSITQPTCGAPDPASSRWTSLDTYRAYTGMVARGGVIGAINFYFDPAYRQHSPVIADGKQGAIDYLTAEWGRPDAPRPVLGEQRVVAEGDLVLVHYMYHLEGQPDEAHVDIFRMTRDGKISEHWDIKQPVPTTAANGNGMW
jgi:predicted SnoaL-like aldol condensation-catalyzing enzyme